MSSEWTLSPKVHDNGNSVIFGVKISELIRVHGNSVSRGEITYCANALDAKKVINIPRN